jgi:hypothetical protein
MHLTSPLAIAVLVTALAPVGSAQANATYLLTLQGTDQRNYPPCRIPDQAPPCDVTADLPWTGLLSIVVDSNGDGVFSDQQVLSFSLQASVGSLSLPFMPGSVTVVDGRVTSVDFIAPYPLGDYFVWEHYIGLNAYFQDAYDGPHEVTDFASGLLTAVPEPASASPMLLALAWAATTAARRLRES